MDRFTELEVFVAVADEAGFAAAARHLDISPPAVTRAVASLEERLGIALFKRTTRHVRLTASGEQYLLHARKLLDDLNTADETVLGTHTMPVGSLSVTAPVFFGKKFVVPCVADFLDEYPGTSVSIALLDRVVNMLEEGFDIGIRIGDLPDSSLRAITVGSVRWTVCVSPDYLREYGEPKSYRDLANHRVIAVGENTGTIRWLFRWKDKNRSIQVTPRLSVNNTEAALIAGKMGHGFVRLLSYQVADAIREGSLVSVLKNEGQGDIPVHVVHREGRVSSALARAFIDHAVAQLREKHSLGWS